MDESERHEAAAKFMPTPDEIAAACEQIQQGWSEDDKRRRRAPERPVCLDTLHRIAEDEE